MSLVKDVPEKSPVRGRVDKPEESFDLFDSEKMYDATQKACVTCEEDIGLCGTLKPTPPTKDATFSTPKRDTLSKDVKTNTTPDGTHNNSVDDLWSDDEFDDSFIIKATQYETEVNSKKRPAPAPPDRLSNVKSGRFTFSLGAHTTEHSTPVTSDCGQFSKPKIATAMSSTSVTYAFKKPLGGLTDSQKKKPAPVASYTRNKSVSRKEMLVTSPLACQQGRHTIERDGKQSQTFQKSQPVVNNKLPGTVHNLGKVGCQQGAPLGVVRAGKKAPPGVIIATQQREPYSSSSVQRRTTNSMLMPGACSLSRQNSTSTVTSTCSKSVQLPKSSSSTKPSSALTKPVINNTKAYPPKTVTRGSAFRSVKPVVYVSSHEGAIGALRKSSTGAPSPDLQNISITDDLLASLAEPDDILESQAMADEPEWDDADNDDDINLLLVADDTVMSENTVKVQTQTVPKNSTAKLQTKPLLSKSTVKLQTKTLLSESTAKLQTKTLLSKSTAKLQTKALLSESTAKLQTKPLPTYSAATLQTKTENQVTSEEPVFSHKAVYKPGPLACKAKDSMLSGSANPPLCSIRVNPTVATSSKTNPGIPLPTHPATDTTKGTMSIVL